MIVRPQPTEHEADNIAKGKARATVGVSSSWFSKGGLEWDGQELKLWDADGEAHAVPLPPNGALVRNITVYVDHGAHTDIPELFVADENKYRTTWFPGYGFGTVDFTELAAGAGLRFVQTRHIPSDADYEWGGYPKTDATIDLRNCAKSSADGSTLGRIFGRHHNG